MTASERPWAGRRLHLVGIGGAGMSGLALVARALGAEVTGSDLAPSSYAERLRAVGIEPQVGHDAAHVPADAEVVHSTAVPPDNPEREEARRRGQPDVDRTALLEEISRLRRTLAIAGTHGKTTTTGMAVHALRACGMEPSFLVGGELPLPGGGATNAAWAPGEWLVVEADESDRSFLALESEVAVVTNVELDHHATYGSEAQLREAFVDFLARAPKAVVWDRPELRALRGEGETVAFDVLDPDLDPAGVRFAWRGHAVALGVPGHHNALNAAAALEACRLAGAPEAEAVAALASFPGVGRRFERLGATASGAEVYDDYAHHPTEVAATLDAARTRRPERLAVAFQPHLYSRTASLWREFGAALARADLVCVLDVYPARERAEDFPGISGRLVVDAAEAAPGPRDVRWTPTHADAEEALRRELRAGDLCLTMGAGDVVEVGRALVEERP